MNALQRLFDHTDRHVKDSAIWAYRNLAIQIMEANASKMLPVYQKNHARFESTHGTDHKQAMKSPYGIEVDRTAGVIRGTVDGKVVVEQPILGELSDRSPPEDFILTPGTKRDLIDLMFFTSQDKLTPIFLLGPTASGKTSTIRYLSGAAGKPFLRVQINSQTDELDLLGHFMPKGLSISYDESAAIIQEHFNTGPDVEDPVRVVVLAAHGETQNKARTDRDFARKEIENALYLGKDETDLVRAVGHILLHGTSGIELEFKKAHFLESLENGDWILLDELNLAREESLGIIYGLLTRGYLDFRGERMTPKEKGGMIFAAGNPTSDVGRQLFSEALENRFIPFYQDRKSPAETAAILYEKYRYRRLDVRGHGIAGRA